MLSSCSESGAVKKGDAQGAQEERRKEQQEANKAQMLRDRAAAMEAEQEAEL